jgi:putative molybdopterin biosynthesis protein
MKGVREQPSMTTAIAARALLTTKDVATLLRVHPKHVYRLMKRDLPALRVGDEWRFDREDVLRWAAGDGGRLGGQPHVSTPPGLVAANGDLVIEILLEHVREDGAALVGLVVADHVGAMAMLERGQVLAAGSHAGMGDQRGKETSNAKTMRLQLVTREIGLAHKTARIRSLRSVVDKRLAVRPSTAGIRRRFDGALADAGVDPSAAYAKAVEYSCHREVALAVARGDADFGLTTRAWAHAAGLSFLSIAEEDYELCFLAATVADPQAVALCETAQSGRFRRQLRQCAGYSVAQTGRLRAR